MPIPTISSEGFQAFNSSHASLVIELKAPPVIDPNEQAIISAMVDASSNRDVRYLIPFWHLPSVQRFAEGMLAEDRWRMTSVQLHQQR